MVFSRMDDDLEMPVEETIRLMGVALPMDVNISVSQTVRN